MWPFTVLDENRAFQLSTTAKTTTASTRFAESEQKLNKTQNFVHRSSWDEITFGRFHVCTVPSLIHFGRFGLFSKRTRVWLCRQIAFGRFVPIFSGYLPRISPSAICMRFDRIDPFSTHVNVTGRSAFYRHFPPEFNGFQIRLRFIFHKR